MKRNVIWAILGIAIAGMTAVYAQLEAAKEAKTVCGEKDGKIVCNTTGGAMNSQAITDCKSENGKIICRTTVR